MINRTRNVLTAIVLVIKFSVFELFAHEFQLDVCSRPFDIGLRGNNSPQARYFVILFRYEYTTFSYKVPWISRYKWKFYRTHVSYDLFESNRIALSFHFHDSILKNLIVRREYKFSIF